MVFRGVAGGFFTGWLAGQFRRRISAKEFTMYSHFCMACERPFRSKHEHPKRCPKEDCGSRRWAGERAPVAAGMAVGGEAAPHGRNWTPIVVPESHRERIESTHHRCKRCRGEWEGPFRKTCPFCGSANWWKVGRAEKKNEKRDKQADRDRAAAESIRRTTEHIERIQDQERKRTQAWLREVEEQERAEAEREEAERQAAIVKVEAAREAQRRREQERYEQQIKDQRRREEWRNSPEGRKAAEQERREAEARFAAGLEADQERELNWPVVGPILAAVAVIILVVVRLVA